MLVIKTHYCLPFHKAVIVCLIAVTFGMNLLLGFVSLQNSFAQEFDTNGDGVVDELDDQSASATSSTDEIQMDTNGDGVVDELDTITTEAGTATGVEGAEEVSTPEDVASSENVVTDEGGVSIADICGDSIDNDADGQMDDLDPEGCMPAYEETVTGGETTTTTATGVEETTDTPENIVPTENQVTTGETSQAEDCKNFVELDCGAEPTDGGETTPTPTPTTTGVEGEVPILESQCDNAQFKPPFCYETCGDNIDNDADGQTDDLDPEGCEPGRKVYDMDELSKLNNKIVSKLIDLKNAAVTSDKFANAVNEFSANLKHQVQDAVGKSEHMSIPQIITVESLRLWTEDPGNQWGEGSWDSSDLIMSASCYAIVPASQNKCNVYVAEVIFLATGITFKVIESKEKPGQYFPYRAKDWGDTQKTIPHFVVVNNPKMGDIWSNGSHTGIYLGEYNGVKLYISARDDGNGVYGVDSVQHEHGIQIKQLPDGGVYRTFTP